MKRVLISLALINCAPNVLATPLLTGVVADVQAQTVEMPSLPGAWQRRIEWMAPEGSRVAVGDLIVRLDPGSLIAEEEKARTDMEKQQFTATRSIDEKRLEVLDAEQALASAESAVRLAELDAGIPVDNIPRLDYERYQLTYATAQKTLQRARRELENLRAELKDTRAQAQLETEQAELEFKRITDALAATQIYAEKAGFMIYGENRFTGRKIFPGDTLYGGLEIASVASREDLQIRLWIHEADYLKLQIGQPLRIAADAQGIEPFDAVLEWRSNQAIEKQDWSESGYFEALAKPQGTLPDSIMPGMSVLAVPDNTTENT
ncbi:MAG: hypothetical protein AAFO81_06435 [Pseudomonadota bacterium]